LQITIGLPSADEAAPGSFELDHFCGDVPQAGRSADESASLRIQKPPRHSVTVKLAVLAPVPSRVVIVCAADVSALSDTESIRAAATRTTIPISHKSSASASMTGAARSGSHFSGTGIALSPAILGGFPLRIGLVAMS
jgi:hypothetical protein